MISRILALLIITAIINTASVNTIDSILPVHNTGRLLASCVVSNCKSCVSAASKLCTYCESGFVLNTDNKSCYKEISQTGFKGHHAIIIVAGVVYIGSIVLAFCIHRRTIKKLDDAIKGYEAETMKQAAYNQVSVANP